MHDPHFLCRHLIEAAAKQGTAVSLKVARSAVASLLGSSDWARLVSEWGTDAGPLPDEQLGNGQVLARRSRQIEVLRALGLTSGTALAVLYELRPTTKFDMTFVAPREVLVSGHAVRDGHFVQLAEAKDGWSVTVGMGKLKANGELVVQSVRQTVVVGTLRHDAANAAAAILTAIAAEVRDAFVGRRAYYAFPIGSLIDTEFGAMDAVELIGEDLGRAFISGSGERGCYLIGKRAARKLPTFAIAGRHHSGFTTLDADGMGLIVPLLFREEFTAVEIEEADRVLAAHYPLTRAVISGAPLTPQNFADVMREWDDAYDLAELPDFMVVQKVKEADGEVVVAAIRTSDMLARRSVARALLFRMPLEEFERGDFINPARHPRLDDDGVGLTVVRVDR